MSLYDSNHNSDIQLSSSQNNNTNKYREYSSVILSRDIGYLIVVDLIFGFCDAIHNYDVKQTAHRNNKKIKSRNHVTKTKNKKSVMQFTLFFSLSIFKIL